jgi:GPI ethanolamine phosphate transferase 1
MVAIGLLYLAFEPAILNDFSRPKESSQRSGDRQAARTLTGVQIGLIVLAMFVTRSSALSLQAKQGLPRGNQAVGWLVMSEPFPLQMKVACILTLWQLSPCLCP